MVFMHVDHVVLDHAVAVRRQAHAEDQELVGGVLEDLRHDLVLLLAGSAVASRSRVELLLRLDVRRRLDRVRVVRVGEVERQPGA